ncbi:MAG TPA: hypothetical protein HPP94_01830 [Desulfuromonadales bacterium]|nr:hypothetical protein [Desulfuromonadales bacterium]
MRQFIVLLIAIECLFLQACSGSGPSTADSNTIDSSSKVLASNTILDNTKTRLVSTTLQSAIEEIAPSKFSDSSFVGKWTVSNYGNGYEGLISKIELMNDGTFSVTYGTFVIGDIAVKQNVPVAGKWQIVKDSLVELQQDGLQQRTILVNNSPTILTTPYDKHYIYPLFLAPSKIIVTQASNISVFEKAPDGV